MSASDDDLRQVWEDAGGDFYGPIVETGKMPEAALLPFLRCFTDRITQLEQWVADLQSGMFINCVYCGHRYGPKDKVPPSMAEVLKQHIAQCPAHPLSHALARVALLEEFVDAYDDWNLGVTNRVRLQRLNASRLAVDATKLCTPSGG